MQQCGSAFASNFEVVKPLGQGSYGKVFLMADRTNQDHKVAQKVVCHGKLNECELQSLRMEIHVNETLPPHPNVVQHLHTIIDKVNVSLYLEYVDNGNLWNQIQNFVGMSIPSAQFYFRQLLLAINYIHSIGIVHRDIKPDNILVTKQHVLKLCDFGLSAVFRINDEDRVLYTRCGTEAFSAPEMYSPLPSYKAEPVDIWSAGIVLITMLVGELPWEGPVPSSNAFLTYAMNKEDIHSPFVRMNVNELSLVRIMVTLNPNNRADLERVARHPWIVGDLSDEGFCRRIVPYPDLEFEPSQSWMDSYCLDGSAHNYMKRTNKYKPIPSDLKGSGGNGLGMKREGVSPFAISF